MRVLWLASWYPSDTEPFEGDFIQRHAQSAALYNDVYVLHISQAVSNTNHPDHTLQKNDAAAKLTGKIVYSSVSASHFPVRIFDQFRYAALQRKHILHYISEYGVPDIVHVHVPVKAGLGALWLHCKYGVPFVVTEHYDIYNETVSDNYNSRSSIFKFFTRLIFKECAMFLPVSRQLGEAVNRYVLPKPFHVVANAVDARYFYFVAAPENQKFRFIHISNLVPRKNVKGIIDAVKLLSQENKEFELLVVGQDPEQMMEHARHCGLDENTIVFTGAQSYQNVGAHIQSSHAMVLFSHSENLPCVVLESLCCGRPVISTAVGGISEVVDENNGMLIDGDVASLVNAMRMMMENFCKFDLEKISRDAIDLYRFETIGKEIDQVYRSLST